MQAAEACKLDVKQYQDIEYGRRKLTTRSLFVLAQGLGLQVGDAFATTDRGSARGLQINLNCALEHNALQFQRST